MKYLLIILLLCNIAFADSLDERITNLNNEFNPKKENDIGYEIDFRSQLVKDKTLCWMNLIRVQKICESKIMYYLKNSQILMKKEYKCQNKITDFTNISLIQILNKSIGLSNCSYNILKEVNYINIKKILDNKIEEVWIE